MTENWHNEIDRLNAQFQTQDGLIMNFWIISASDENLLLLRAAADHGHENANVVLVSLMDWYKTMERAVDENLWPGCAGCNIELHKGEVAGFAVLMPKGEGIGLVSAFCAPCMRLDMDELQRRFRDNLDQELGGELQSLQ